MQLGQTCFLSHSKHDVSFIAFENLFKILTFNFEMNVANLGKMWAHGHNFEKKGVVEIQNTILVVKNMIFIIGITSVAFMSTLKKKTCQFWTTWKLMGPSLKNFWFLSHSEHDCMFENLFKILIFSFERNVTILVKMWAHGCNFEKLCFLSHSKETIYFCIDHFSDLYITMKKFHDASLYFAINFANWKYVLNKSWSKYQLMRVFW